jgi:hypothetical protein
MSSLCISARQSEKRTKREMIEERDIFEISKKKKRLWCSKKKRRVLPVFTKENQEDQYS